MIMGDGAKCGFVGFLESTRTTIDNVDGGEQQTDCDECHKTDECKDEKVERRHPLDILLVKFNCAIHT